MLRSECSVRVNLFLTTEDVSGDFTKNNCYFQQPNYVFSNGGNYPLNSLRTHGKLFVSRAEEAANLFGSLKL